MEGVFLLLTMIVSLIYEESDWWAYLLSASISFVIGRICIWLSRRDKDNRSFTRADSFMIVTLSWVIFSVIGMIPFILIEKMDLASAFFETMSGFTTTGATVITDIDSMTHALRFWRSLTQWMGGLGIVVFSFALIPVSEMKNNNIFSAEVTGIGLDKIRPKIGSTARRLLIIYLILTLICTGLYYVGPMNIYDAVCHSLSTIATGGFSTHSESSAYFHSTYIEYIWAVFMILSSINFSLFYYASMRKWHVLKQNEEVKVFLTVVLCMTGFFFFLFCFAVGACAGSTAGGMKIIRAIICAKSVRNEFIRQMHPNAVLGVRINGNIISDSRVKHSLGFLFLYIAMVVIGMTILTYIGLDVDTGLGACISSLSNVGPGTGECGPSGTFAHVPALGKWLLSFYMLVGRLEIYTVLFLFMPIFFKGTK